MFKPSFNERGVALYLVLMTVLIVAILSGVILTIILSQVRLSYHQIGRTRAYYAALAAMNLAFDRLNSQTWGTGLYTFGKCSPNWTGCNVNDADIPYRVNISIGDNLSGRRQINLTVNYTYVP